MSRGSLFLFAGLLAGLVSGRAAEPAAPITVFAFDDATIPYRYHLALTMVPATKYAGNPVLHDGAKGSPDEHRAQFYGSVLRVDGKFRMWYMAMAFGRRRSVEQAEQEKNWPAYAESEDGIHWTKPELGEVEYNGSKRNNLMSFSPAPRFDLTEPLCLFVLHEPEDPNPGHRYKMALYTRYLATYPMRGVPHRKASVTAYFSADGLHWNLASPPPKAGAYEESDVPFPVETIFELGGLYHFNGVYAVTGHQDVGTILLPTGQPGARTLETHYSPDFVHWSRDFNIAFMRYGYRSKADLNEAHEGAAVWSRGNLLLATYGEWQGAAERHDVRMPLGFLISNDGVHFREPQPDFVFIPPGPVGTWDQRGLIHGQGFENVGDRTYIYYGAWDLAAYDSHNILPAGVSDPGGGVGLATIRRDGFGYLSVRGEGESLFTTAPLVFATAKSRLKVNVAGLGPDARLRIELLDASGLPVPGYSGEQAAVAVREGLAQPVAWPEAAGGPPPGSYRLRFHFEGAQRSGIRFYAAYLE